MALGLFLTEELLWAADGTQRNIGSWEYKIPAAHDIPLALNVSFLPKAPNPSAVAALRSKASAEPPMALGAAAFFAACDAIRSARRDAGVGGPLEVDAPLTVERVREACAVAVERFGLR